MDLSIIIVNYNVYSDTLKCVESINKYFNNIKFEIIVVDNNSSNRSILNIITVYPEVKLITLKDNCGFGYANNIAMKIAYGKYFLLVNPDIIFQDNSVKNMIKFLENSPSAGVVGPVQIKPNDGIERYYCFFPTLYSRFAQEFGFYQTAPLMKYRFNDFWNNNIAKLIPFKVDWVIGSCMMLKREVYNKLGGFNEAFFLYEEETEWQYRMNQKGWDSFILPECKVLHNHHSSVSKFGYEFILYHEFRSRIIFCKLHIRGIKYYFRCLMILYALILRLAIYLRYSTNWVYFKKRLKLTFDLIKLTLNSKQEAVNKRYNIEKSIFIT